MGFKKVMDIRKLALVSMIFLLGLPLINADNTIFCSDSMWDTWVKSDEPNTNKVASQPRQVDDVSGIQTDDTWFQINNLSNLTGLTIVRAIFNLNMSTDTGSHNFGIGFYENTDYTRTPSTLTWNNGGSACRSGTSCNTTPFALGNVTDGNLSVDFTNQLKIVLGRADKTLSFRISRLSAGSNQQAYIRGKAVSPICRINLTLEYNSGSSVGNNLTATAQNIINASTILNYTLTLAGTTNTKFSTVNGTVPIGNITNGFYNLTFVAESENGGYYNTTYYNVNISGQSFQANLTPYFYVYSVSLSNFVNYSTQNYTRNLTYTINLSCPSFYTSSLNRYINSSLESQNSLSCNNQSQLINLSYSHGQEGNYTIGVTFNNSYLPNENNRVLFNGRFLSDLNSPTVAYLNFSFINGFYNSRTNISLTCNDTIAPILTNNLTFNSVNYRYQNITTGQNIKNDTNFNDGSNILIGKCQDFFSTASLTRNLSIYFATLYLIDEKDNTLFNLANVTGARAYFDDNSTYYDFKTNNNNAVNFTSDVEDKIRVELVYSNGDIVTRYIDVGLIENDIRICANKEGVNHYENLIYSNTQKVALMKSLFSNCYVGADYTRFAYQDALMLKVFTIATQYYLQTYRNSQLVIIASVDGSTSSLIDIDAIEFGSTAYNINVLTDSMNFANKLTPSGTIVNNTVVIYYSNLKGDNTEASLTITRMDTNSLVYSSGSLANPNNFTIYFDWNSLSNISNATVFRLDFTKTNTEETTTSTYYFNIQGNAGNTDSRWAFAIAFMLTIFGMTLTITRSTFGFIGILTSLISIFILASSIGVWYVNLVMMMNAIILLYIVLVAYQNNWVSLT